MEIHMKCIWGKYICKQKKKILWSICCLRNYLHLCNVIKDLLIVLWQTALTSLWHPNQIVYWMDPTTGCVH